MNFGGGYMFQVRVSNVLRFISICDLFTNFPAHHKNGSLVFLRRGSLCSIWFLFQASLMIGSGDDGFQEAAHLAQLTGRGVF
jgi:hypothetical protein